ncbi:MAG: GNAT family N-acetyltransferase [Sneathiellales bacterium]|nr:GNAT family N-acetyltransferase [Sneathiellales bacterium]
MEFLLDGIVPDVTADQLLAVTLTETQSPLSYSNTVVLDEDNEVKGVMLGYSLKDFSISGEMKMFVEQNRVDHVRGLYTQKIPNSYYIHALSVDDSVQGRGGGKALIEIAKDIALDQGFDNLSLHVWQDNLQALSLYKAVGFEEISLIPIERHKLLPHDGGMLLLKFPL